VPAPSSPAPAGGFIPDKFSPGLRTLYAREYSGISKISQFRQNTPVQKYFLTLD
jgi:hypothetical protein